MKPSFYSEIEEFTKNEAKEIEKIITKTILPYAEALGVEFKVKCKMKDRMRDVLVRIKQEKPTSSELSEEELTAYKELSSRNNRFAKIVSNAVVGVYVNEIRFTYPVKL